MSTESTDVAIVGAGACGSVIAHELVARGISVVTLEAGKRFDPLADLPNSEANAAKIVWTEPRGLAGKHGMVPKSGIGVGGGTLAWLGVAPRFHHADFRTYSTEGVGADWPISYDDLRPYYDKVERQFGLAGECGPFAPEPYALPMPPHPMNWHAGLERWGHTHLLRRSRSILSHTRAGRLACIAAGALQDVPLAPKRRHRKPIWPGQRKPACVSSVNALSTGWSTTPQREE